MAPYTARLERGTGKADYAEQREALDAESMG